MADNKNQHYVPQFYLKRFSSGGNQISLLNINTGRIINNASIKGQCSEDHFYGKDGTTEEALKNLEGIVAGILNDISKNQNLPKNYSESHRRLMFYLSIQNARTLYSKQLVNEIADKAAKSAFKLHTGEDIEESIEIRLTQPLQLQINKSVENFPLLLDLKQSLLINKTNEEFICSDNPVVFYNQFLEERTFAGNTGYMSVGLQIFFPISPTLMLFFFDKDVYGMGKKESCIKDILLDSDVKQLNQTQYVNALENVYFSNSRAGSEKSVRGLTKLKGKRRTRKSNIKVHPDKKIESGEISNLITCHPEDIRTDLKLSFLKTKKKAKKQKDDVMHRMAVRDDELFNLFEQYKQLRDQGQLQEGAFMAFLEYTGYLSAKTGGATSA